LTTKTACSSKSHYNPGWPFRDFQLGRAGAVLFSIKSEAIGESAIAVYDFDKPEYTKGGFKVAYIEEFLEFLAIPSISALPEHKPDIAKASEWLRAKMARAGIEDVQIITGKGHPVVFGRKNALATDSSQAPTVLIYGHYDTQPADPLDEWLSPPFEPEIRDGKIYARGSADNKGGVFPAILAAQEAIADNSLPVNLKFLFEGEEEIGSPTLKALLDANKGLFECDLVLSVDGGMYSKDIPSITTGCRGLAAIQIEVSGPGTDVHSGGHGGAIHNPIHALAEILVGLKDNEGRILVEGFYDSVTGISEEERKKFSEAPFDEDAYRTRVGVPALFGEPEYSLIERMWVRPTLDANGIWGGFQGEGVKTIIPARAGCKITCRLVPDQDPEDICKALENHIKKHTPKGVGVSVTIFPGNSKPYVIPDHHPVLPVVAGVLEELYGHKPVNVRLGGTLPIARAFLDILGTHLFFFAMSSPDANAHGPNEFIRIDEFERLRKGLRIFWDRYAASQKT
jgi:acetylornithine deacetylase/succinyl-diaminopimelate desuccinylase-like protein